MMRRMTIPMTIPKVKATYKLTNAKSLNKLLWLNVIFASDKTCIKIYCKDSNTTTCITGENIENIVMFKHALDQALDYILLIKEKRKNLFPIVRLFSLKENSEKSELQNRNKHFFSIVPKQFATTSSTNTTKILAHEIENLKFRLNKDNSNSFEKSELPVLNLFLKKIRYFFNLCHNSNEKTFKDIASYLKEIKNNKIIVNAIENIELPHLNENAVALIKNCKSLEFLQDCNNWCFNASDFDILSNLILEEEFDVSAEKKNSRYSRALQNFEPNDAYMNDKSNKIVEIDERHFWIIKTYERFMDNQNKSNKSKKSYYPVDISSLRAFMATMCQSNSHGLSVNTVKLMVSIIHKKHNYRVTKNSQRINGLKLEKQEQIVGRNEMSIVENPVYN